MTLNLGLRYEFTTQFLDANGRNSSLRDVVNDAAFTLGPLFKNPSRKNFSPRFGFAWDPRGDGKTAVRGGFGLLYDIGNVAASIIGLPQTQQPFSSNSAYVNPPTLTIPFFFPPGALGKSSGSPNYHLQQPHLLGYNLTVERQLPFAMALTVSYVGSRGINLIRGKEGNPTFSQILADGRQFWTGTELRRNPNWANIIYTDTDANSFYNALQVGLNKRLSRGLQLQGSYTWSKGISDAIIGSTLEQIGNVNGGPSDPLHRQVDRGLSDFDVTHNWRFNAIYRFPELTSTGGFLGKMINGWMVSGILTAHSGLPFSAAINTNR